jgi:DNA-binding response OmpR family regulator
MDHPINSARDGSLTTPTSYCALIVEDHADTRLMLKTILEMQNFGVLEAADGRMAIEMAAEYTPDIILMDSGLPLADGITATRTIRKQKKMGHVPIIFLSGHAGPTSQKAARDAGCNEYLVKPISIEEMLRLVNRLLGPRRMETKSSAERIAD